MRNKKYTQEELSANLRDIEELKVISVSGFRIIISPEVEDIGLVFSANNTEYVLPISRLESMSASFHLNGFSTKAHIPDIYAAYIHFAKSMGMQLLRAIIEAKQGDVVYGRVIWKDAEGKKFTQVTTAGDVFILGTLTNVKIGIVTTLLEELTPLDDWPYSYDVDEW